jgi:hypothetical protein
MLDNRCADHRFTPVDDITDTLTRKLREIDPVDDAVSRGANSAKTRFLGFKLTSKPQDAASANGADPVPGEALASGALARVSIAEGPGRGHTFSITNSFTRIGRDKEQEIQLAFGDTHISREEHATIVHYGDGIGFVIRDGLRVNPVLLNNRTIRGDTPLRNGDMIRIGATTLRFETIR